MGAGGTCVFVCVRREWPRENCDGASFDLARGGVDGSIGERGGFDNRRRPGSTYEGGGRGQASGEGGEELHGFWGDLFGCMWVGMGKQTAQTGTRKEEEEAH